MGLPLAGQVGVPSTSTLLVLISGKSVPCLPLYVNVPLTAAGTAVEPDLCSCFIGGVALAVLISDDAARSCEAACCRVVRDPALCRIRKGSGKQDG